MLLEALWGVLPAYFANSSAVVWGGGTPLDLGLRLPGGNRLLGDGKTYRGLVGGTATGVLAAGILSLLAPPLGMPEFPVKAALGLSLGALIGDVSASFLKRRFGIERGGPAPLADQLDFLLGALVLTYLIAAHWFRSLYPPAALGFVIVATPVIHISFNFIAHRTGLKGEPW